jgi:hypothetical protein
MTRVLQEIVRIKKRPGMQKNLVRAQFHLSDNIFDSQSAGTLALQNIAGIALPFYIAFESIDDLKTYYDRRSNLMSIVNGTRDIYIDWNSELGVKLARTLVLTDDAKRFVIYRDLNARRSVLALAMRPIAWAFACSCVNFVWSIGKWFINAMLVKSNRYANLMPLRQSPIVFVGLYAIALYAISFMFEGHIVFSDNMRIENAEHMSAQQSRAHAIGGHEYYLKMLNRNRILRQLVPIADADRWWTETGDERALWYGYFDRYVNRKLDKREDAAFDDDDEEEG